jgi:glycosyltransferase involved in cell wall biosynthesis
MIGVVTTSYPRFSGDPAGVFVQERVRALLQAGHSVEVLAAGPGHAPSLDLSGKHEPSVIRIPARGIFYDGGAPEALESAHLLGRLQAWAQAWQFTGAMLERLVSSRDRWQAVESHWLLPCGLLVCAALPNLAHRAHVHGGDLFLLARLPWGDSLARVFCRSRPQLVFASAGLRERFTALLGAAPESLGARCLVEPASFDVACFHRRVGERAGEERRRLRAAFGFDRPTVLAAGRLVPIKGFDVLLAALASIPPVARPDLVLAGEGPERDRLTRQGATLGLRIHLVGMLRQDQLADVMTAADLFAHPCRVLANGRSEGMPLVVREALACGLPVIASANGGLPELAGAPGLALVTPDDPDALAAAILAALAKIA